MLFPILTLESLIQEQDKTRLDGSKSYSSGAAVISYATIKPSKLESAIDVSEDLWLDWQYAFEIEIDSTNNLLPFKEAGTDYAAVLSDGVYSLADLCAEIATQMTAAGGLNYEAVIDSENSIMISANGNFDLTGVANPSASILSSIGFSKDVAGKPSYSGDNIETITKEITFHAENEVVIDATNSTLNINTGTAQPVNIAEATYSNHADLITAVVAALNANTDGTIFTVTRVGRKLTIAGDVAFDILCSITLNSAWGILGFVGSDRTGLLTYTSQNLGTVQEITRTIPVISVVADHLFSTDDQMTQHETDIMRYVKEGRASWINIHRRAQQLIMQWMDTQGFINDFLEKFPASAIKDVTEVREWSVMVALRLAYESISNSKEDIFRIKANSYESREEFYRNRAVIRLDMNKDGRVDLGEQIDVRNAVVVRR